MNNGELIGPWCLLQRVGSGSNGIVYKACLAERPEDGVFALKLARDEADPRFEREAEMLSRLSHPNVPALRDRGVWRRGNGRDYPYLVMQWVEGIALYDWAKRHNASSRQAMWLLSQVARALEATHKLGTHRDVKGDNVLVREDGTVMLVDYGCCRYEGARPLTETVVPPGTAPYRSPACLRFRYRHRMDPEAHYDYPPEDDLYALGVTAYYLSTGTYPPPGTDPESSDKPGRARPPKRVPPSQLARVAPELESLIFRMLQEDGKERGTAGALAEALEKAAQSAGPAADLPMTPRQRLEWPRPASPQVPPRRPSEREVLSLNDRALTTLTGLAVLLLVIVVLPLQQAWSERQRRMAEALGQQSADKVGLGDGGVEEALTSVHASGAQVGVVFIGRQVPKDPFKGQRKAPCTDLEVTIHGYCWVEVGRKKPPCGQGYEHEGFCYIPSFNPPREPTSEPP
jgi:serine/threonine protein kinase